MLFFKLIKRAIGTAVVAAFLSFVATFIVTWFDAKTPVPFYTMVVVFVGWFLFDVWLRTRTDDAAPRGKVSSDDDLFEDRGLNPGNGPPMAGGGIDVGGHAMGSTDH